MFTFKELISLPFQLIKSIVKLHKELKGIKIDIVQTNTVVVTLGFIYAKMKGIPHYWHIHEVMDSPKIAVKIFPALVNRFSDFTIFNSETTKESFCKIKPTIRNKSVVIYNGLDKSNKNYSQEELAELKKSLSFQKEDIVFGLIGRINFDKGHLLLLNAFNTLARKNDDIKLLFIGSPVKGKEEILAQINQQILDLQLSEKVKILSFQNDIWKFWNIIDIAITPSTIKESFCLAALEAMLSEKPVIASNFGALPELVKDNESGFLFDVNSSQSLEEKMSILVGNKSLRRSFGEKGKEIALQKFTLSKYVNQFEKIYAINDYQ